MQYKAELIIDAKAELAEGPSWDHLQRILYWVDIEGKKVFIYHPETGENHEIQLDQRVGAVVPKKTDGAIVALENGFFDLDTVTGKVTPIQDPESHLSENRFNDGKCDPSGRFWAGTMHLYGKQHQGALYVMDQNLNITQKLNHVSTSNGLAWSPDHHFMYYIDTPTKKVVRFDYNLQSGEITDPKDVVIFSDGDGKPDGMTIDEEGNLWIAHWGGSKVSQWNPDTGEKLKEIPVPALNVTSCVFGGEHLNELYITTARQNMDDQELLKYPNAGGVFRVKTDIKGSPTYRFGK